MLAYNNISDIILRYPLFQVKTNRTSEARDTGMDSPIQHGASETGRLFENRSDMGALYEALNYVMERIQNRAIK